MAKGNFIAYYRVSTAKQGISGLGLEAQQEAVRQYLNGGQWTLRGQFTEVESGRKKERPELEKALAAARLYKATLVVAKLDRLSRNAAFLMTLRDSGVSFVAADMPDANSLTVGVLALVAQHEAEAISQRTKAALAAAKKRGTKLGGLRPGHRPLTAKARKAGTAARQARSVARAMDLRPTLEALQAAGCESLRAIARGLEERGIPTPSEKGGKWSAVQVQRALKAAGLAG